ncbi:50S ribosomal protein L12P [Methanocella paludicola SANAE]|uniref:Large ribosomal subunit protein P1 n=1 Tax=Methanocella paludicola (strain DSM 17711 / JCM 13418 / NBRC 101707 / SANAE) TaxID=304371 RepID=D1Z0C5_METPS|nr:50S ribosomal protein P1 [Methanocella paludicola]BAI62147.1 50S ribosomal protein L12P [Methanocella paludicola SANAE]
MEYVYAALLLHKAGKPVDETGVTSVLKAAGVEVNEARVKALVAALEGVNIDEAISKAAFAAAPAAAAAAPAAGAPAAAAPQEEEKKKEEEEASGMEGLSALFG